jgi:alpha-methylacyl-CoA racemase
MGPLKGLRVIELEGLGAAPFCGMLLADLGADVISVARESSAAERPGQVSERGKRSIALNLKHGDAVEVILRLCAQSDVLIEGFRPGVAERLGVGPEPCWARNRALVYGRMTGWGQSGPLATAPGHDINYIALSGALHAIGLAGQRPVPPLNLVGDFGGGAMFLALGVMCAVFEARQSGLGQVVDASMAEGSAALMHMMYGMAAQGLWTDDRGTNLLDGGAHFYGTYETADGKFVAIGAIEPQFYRRLIALAGVDADEFVPQMDRARWPELRERLAAVIRGRTRDEWCALMEGSDACLSPVMSLREAPMHPHNRARGTFFESRGVVQPAPTPRFTRTAPEHPRPPRPPGSDAESVLRDAGYSDAEILALRERGALT